jgi:ribose transport system permease protein
MKRPRSLGLDKYSGLYIWALFIIVFSLWTPNLFPTASTVHSIASGQAVAAILTLAVLVPLIAGAYDLSIGATVNLSAIVAVYLQTVKGWSMTPAIVAAVLCGTLIGLANGFIVVRLGVNSFIATLGMGSIIAAVQTIVTSNNQPVPPNSTAWTNLTQTEVLGFQMIVVYLLIFAVVFWWALEHTPPGRYLHAIGANAEASRLSGVNVGRWTWLSLIVSGTMSAAAGVLYASLVGPSLTFGPGLLLPAFAAAFLGSTQLKPGRFNVWGSMIAIYVLATGVQGFQYVTTVQWLSDMFYGVGLIAAVSFAVWRQRAAAQRSRPTAEQRTPEAGGGDGADQSLRLTGESMAGESVTSGH